MSESSAAAFACCSAAATTSAGTCTPRARMESSANSIRIMRTTHKARWLAQSSRRCSTVAHFAPGKVNHYCNRLLCSQSFCMCESIQMLVILVTAGYWLEAPIGKHIKGLPVSNCHSQAKNGAAALGTPMCTQHIHAYLCSRCTLHQPNQWQQHG